MGRLPDGWSWGWIPAVACDSQDRVFVYSRSEHPLVVFDRHGRFLEEWGAGVLEDAHGIFIDDQDNVFCTERNTHCMHKFDRNGKLVMTIGTPRPTGCARRRPVQPSHRRGRRLHRRAVHLRRLRQRPGAQVLAGRRADHVVGRVGHRPRPVQPVTRRARGLAGSGLGVRPHQ